MHKDLLLKIKQVIRLRDMEHTMFSFLNYGNFVVYNLICIVQNPGNFNTCLGQFGPVQCFPNRPNPIKSKNK